MKYLKEFKIFESKSEIDSICKKYGIENYTINEDGSVDVNGDVNLSNKGLTKLPLKFGKVKGDFHCGGNELTSLEGCPKEVGGGFWCSYNELTSLEGCPEKVGGCFDCSNNKLTSLEGCPKEVNGSFWCYYNQLTSLKGCPKEVGDVFDCCSNQIVTLGHDLEDVKIGGIIYIGGNPIYEVYRIFDNFKKFKESILDYGYFTKPGEPFIDKVRFEEACLDQDIELPTKIKGYTFI